MSTSVQPIKSCLVTGGAGFIGSHLVEGLLEAGYQVRVLDNLTTGKLSNLDSCFNQIDWVQGDIRDYDTVLKACKGMDAVLHHAAIASVYQSIQEPRFTHEVNVNGTINVLDAATQTGVKKLTFASSAAVYGPDATLPKVESMIPNPISPYALHKLIGEQYAEMYSKLYGIKVVCFRYFNIYGPRQDHRSHYSGVISIFINSVLSNIDPVIYGDGQQSRDFVSVSDVKQANLLALSSNSFDFEVCNVGNGLSHSLIELLDWIKKHTDKDFKIQYKPDRRGDLRHSVADIHKISSLLGFQPSKSFDAGLLELLQSFKASAH